MRPVMLAGCTVLVLLALQAGCSRPVPRVAEPTPAPLPQAEYRAAAAAGAAIYRLDPAASRIVVHVGRDGPMRRLGHDHAVASGDLRGLVAWFEDRSRTRADVVFALRELVVDRPGDRERLGLDAGPGEEDIRGTYANMLKVLEPETFPWASMQATFADGEGQAPAGTLLDIAVTLHGNTHGYRVPVELERTPGRLRVSGAATLTHSEFGLEPYTAAGGLLRVAGELEVTFELAASRVETSPPGAGEP